MGVAHNAAYYGRKPLIYALTADIDEKAKDFMLEAGFKAIYHILDTSAIKEIMENAGLVFKPHGKNLQKSKDSEEVESSSLSYSPAESANIYREGYNQQNQQHNYDQAESGDAGDVGE